MTLTAQDIQAIWLTIRLAGIVTVVLLVLGIPLAWWLSQTKQWWRRPISAVVTLPLVLPPSVLGFYFLLLTSPASLLGRFVETMGLGTLPFTFQGLVLASVVYSLPFMIQPLQATFETINRDLLEAASTLGAKPFDRFITIVLPLSWPGVLSACMMTFAHTIGEFGVVLMIGGNIPGTTRVLSVQLYDYVEALEYGKANDLALLMVGFSFCTLLFMQLISRRRS